MESVRPSSRGASRCPFCHDDLAAGAATVACASCGAEHHGPCWDELGACASCRHAAPPAPGAAGVPGPAPDTWAMELVGRDAPPWRLDDARVPPPPRLRIEEDAGALTLARSHRDAASWLAVPLFAAFMLAALVAVAAGVERLTNAEAGWLHRAVGLFPLLFGAAMELLFAGGILNALAGEERLRVGPDLLTLEHTALGIPLGRTRRAAAADVTDVVAEDDVVRVLQGQACLFEWRSPALSPAEAAWVAARARRHLGLK